jgi:protein TonB
MKLIALFIVAMMLAACAPRATSNAKNSVDPAKESKSQDKVKQDSTANLKDRSESNLTAVVQENMPKRLNAIYNNYLTQRPGFEGEIEARIVLLADGNVEKVEIANATTDYPEFEKAIADDLTQWKYDSGDYYKCTLKVPMKFLNENDNVQMKIEDGLTVLKGRSSKKITEVFKLNTQTNSKKIYNEFLKKRPRFKGKIVVRITVIPSGDVEKVEIVSATTDYPEFEKAIVDDLMQWKYDSGNYLNCTFTIPLTFWED